MKVIVLRVPVVPFFVAALVASGSAAAVEGKDGGTGRTAARHELAERLSFRQDGRQRAVIGRLVAETEVGEILFQADDGALWRLDRHELIDRQPLGRSFKPLTQTELAERILSEMPSGFRVHTTTRYVVCYNTSRAYAQWIGSLLERLYRAFTNYWENQGLELREPEFPLVAIVFADRQSYDAASQDDLPGGTGTIIGYYSLRSNRVNMFDLTGVEAVHGGGSRRGSLREINPMLSQPAAEPLVATVVHEATHQIAFNCGLMSRYADVPLWLCEGMAVYFETPDLASTRAWRGIGRLNYRRLETFRDNLPNWQKDSLQRLLTDDRQFRDPHTALAAYADAWALNYYLIKYKPAAYAGYLKTLSKKRPLVEDSPQQRLDEFRQHFGNLARLEREFLRSMSRVK